MYRSGLGVTQDLATAVKWYRLAAEQGNSNAQLNLGIIYEYGLGLPQNNLMAHAWYQMAANNGYKQAFEYMADRAAQMNTEDIIKAQSMAKECMNSGYKKCGY
jgi:TPR repeat protein